MSFPRLPWITLSAVLALPLLTGACAVPIAVTLASYAADGVSAIATGKTSTDHLLSMTSQQDCAMWRALQNKAVCKEREDGVDPYDVDYKTPERLQSEDGSYYQAPLRSASAVPATSWDGAAYKSEPTEPKKGESMTAVVSAAPAPIVPAAQEPQVTDAAPPSIGSPAVVPPAKKKAHSVKPKKPRTAAKKPSRGPAAPRS